MEKNIKKWVNYKEYISSVDWLLKKHELISIYLSRGWSIQCDICESKRNINVHHKTYEQLGCENLKDDGSGDIWNLQFLCRDCHKKWHFDENFKNIVSENSMKSFNQIILKPYGK